MGRLAGVLEDFGPVAVQVAAGEMRPPPINLKAVGADDALAAELALDPVIGAAGDVARADPLAARSSAIVFCPTPPAPV